METQKHCPSCHSDRIIPNADAVDHDALAIRIYEKPDLTLKNVRYYPLKAWVCTQCGLTQFYVGQPEELARSYQRFLNRA